MRKIHSGNSSVRTPLGEEVEIAGLSAYYTEDGTSTRGPQTAIVLVGDVCGWDSLPMRLYADRLARKGFLVVVPNIFYSDAVPLEYIAKDDLDGFVRWAERNPADTVMSDLERLMQALGAEYGVTFEEDGPRWGGLGSAMLAGTELMGPIVEEYQESGQEQCPPPNSASLLPVSELEPLPSLQPSPPSHREVALKALDSPLLAPDAEELPAEEEATGLETSVAMLSIAQRPQPPVSFAPTSTNFRVFDTLTRTWITRGRKVDRKHASAVKGAFIMGKQWYANY